MKPRIFIASSVEGKPIADVIQYNLSHAAYPKVWSQMVFKISSYPLEALMKAVTEHDFGVVVLSPDDLSILRGMSATVPRSNVIFEAALFMGKYGRDRCFLVQPRNHPDFILPTDLLGLCTATYDESHYQQDAVAALGSACTAICEGIRNSASFGRAVNIGARLELHDPLSSTLYYPKKLVFRVQNPTNSMVLVTSCDFDMGERLKGHPERCNSGNNRFRVEFVAYAQPAGCKGKDAGCAGKDIYLPEILLKPGAAATAWLALDRATDDSEARDAREKKQIGTWRFTCHWLTEPMELRTYEVPF